MVSTPTIGQTLLDSVSDGLCLIDRQGALLHVNTPGRLAMGVAETNPEGISLPATPVARAMDLAGKIAQALDQDEPLVWDAVLSHERSKPALLWQCTLRHVSMPDGPGLLLILTEPAKRNHLPRRPDSAIRQTGALTEALHQGRCVVEALGAATNACISFKDRQGAYQYVSAGMAALLGKSVEHILGQTERDLIGDEFAADWEEVDARVFQGETVHKRSSRLREGTMVSFEDVRTPVWDEKGEIIGLCGISRDVTERTPTQRGRMGEGSRYSSPASQELFTASKVLARTKSTLLITGESGVGKDYMARYIHEQSSRSAAPYFSVNCAALPPPLAESELFGHVSGAFTGAWRLKRGLLEIAEGGTLLLNEIGELSLPLQAKLLTFLDTKSFTRVGGTEAVTVNVRVIAATNRDLPLEVDQRRFRADLFYRLNVMTLRVTPLRERKQDLPLVVNDLLGHIAAEMELETLPHPSPATLEAIMSHHWPGNIRELRNCLQRGLVASGGRRLDLSDMGLVDPQDRDWLVSLRLPGGTSFQEALREMKRHILEEALLRSSGRIQGAARLLKMSRYSFSRQMQRAKPDPPDSSTD